MDNWKFETWVRDGRDGLSTFVCETKQPWWYIFIPIWGWQKLFGGATYKRATYRHTLHGGYDWRNTVVRESGDEHIALYLITDILLDTFPDIMHSASAFPDTYLYESGESHRESMLDIDPEDIEVVDDIEGSGDGPGRVEVVEHQLKGEDAKLVIETEKEKDDWGRGTSPLSDTAKEESSDIGGGNFGSSDDSGSFDSGGGEDD